MHKVIMDTSFGELTLELDDEKAPNTVGNFLQYVRDGHFDGTIFHRVINDFMVQGGGFTPDMEQKPTRGPVRSEADNGLLNRPYTLAMARTSDPHSATAQFFINVSDNGFLNYTAPTVRGYGYTVFGKVVQGQDVVDRMKAVKTGTVAGHQDVPLEPITIVKAEVVGG